MKFRTIFGLSWLIVGLFLFSKGLYLILNHKNLFLPAIGVLVGYLKYHFILLPKTKEIPKEFLSDGKKIKLIIKSVLIALVMFGLGKLSRMYLNEAISSTILIAVGSSLILSGRSIVNS